MPGPHNLLHLQDVYKQYGDKLILDNKILLLKIALLVNVKGRPRFGNHFARDPKPREVPALRVSAQRQTPMRMQLCLANRSIYMVA